MIFGTCMLFIKMHYPVLEFSPMNLEEEVADAIHDQFGHSWDGPQKPCVDATRVQTIACHAYHQDKKIKKVCQVLVCLF